MSAHEGGLASADSGLGGGPAALPTGGAILVDATFPADGGLPSAAEFADVNVPADFTQPISLPPPATTIQGDAASLVGSWVEVWGGAPCTAQGGMCWHMEIQQDSGGAVRGFIYLLPPLLPGNPPQPVGPFPPPTDPNVGYPPGVSPSDYFSVKGITAGVDYPMLDGAVSGGSFSFWFSALSIWSGWCALQTPYARTVRGEVVYRCVPETATLTNTDVGKLDLCSSATDTSAQCTDPQGYTYPCVCLDDAGTFSFSLPGCGLSVCECSATECHADLRGGGQNASLAMDGGTLQGMMDTGSGFTSTISFQRVMP